MQVNFSQSNSCSESSGWHLTLPSQPGTALQATAGCDADRGTMLPPPPLDRLRRPCEREVEPEQTDEEVRSTARRGRWLHFARRVTFGVGSPRELQPCDPSVPHSARSAGVRPAAHALRRAAASLDAPLDASMRPEPLSRPALPAQCEPTTLVAKGQYPVSRCAPRPPACAAGGGARRAGTQRGQATRKRAHEVLLLVAYTHYHTHK